MKKLYMIMMLVIAGNLANAQNYVWAKSIGNTGTDNGWSIALDVAGNCYVTGTFSGTVDFDPSAGTANLTSLAGIDIFFAKYDANGNYLWAKSIGSTGDDWSMTIAVDGTGNTYISGQFDGTADFDPGVGTVNMTATNKDIFFAKYDNNGNYLWAKKISSAGWDNTYRLTLDNAGNIYMTGYFSGTADFDPGAGTANLTSLGNPDIFFAKYNTNGDYLWAKSIGSSGYDYGYGIAVDGSGNCYLTGNYAGTADFDPGPGTANLTLSGSFDAFIAKYDYNGNYIWAKGIGSAGDDLGYGIALDGTGNCFVTGIFSGTTDFDPGVGTATLTSNGGRDIFFARYDANGNYLWAKSMGSTNDDYGLSIKVDGADNCLITGKFSGAADFDPGAGTVNLNPVGGEDIFFAKYDVSGNYLWAKNIGSTGNDRGSSIAIDGTGNFYLTGFYADAADFDPGAGTATLTPIGGQDVFIAKYSYAVGIDENIIETSISIFPNPAKEIIEVRSKKFKVKSMEIYSIQGMLLRSFAVNDNATTIDISGLASGIYIIKAKMESGIVVRKFVKE